MSGARGFGVCVVLVVFSLLFPVESQAQSRTDESWPEKLGPAEVETGQGKLKLGFVGQVMDQYLDKDLVESRDKTFKFVLRRVRFYPRGTFLDDRLRFAMQLSTAPGSLELMDYWFQWKFHDHLQVRVGQFKVPFSRYRQQSFTSLLLVDWANVSTYFGAERQLGLLLHNAQSKPRFEYAVGILSGQNVRASHGVGVPKVYGELPSKTMDRPNPSNLVDPQSLEPWHPELMVRVAHNTPGTQTLVPSDKRRSGFRHIESLSIAWDTDPTATSDYALRIVPEVMIKCRGASLILGSYLGFVEMTQSDKTRFAMVGTLAEAAYGFDKHWEITARFSRVDMLKILREDIIKRADALIEGAAGTDEEESVQARFRDVGQTRAEQEVGMGLNVNIVGTDLRWSSDLSWLRKYRTDVNRDDMRIRSQLQVAF